MPARKSAKKPARKKATAKKKAAASAPPSSAKPDEAAEEPDAPAASAKKGAVTAKDVNLGHVFALRPRVRTSFRQPDFLRARELLEDETYESASDAARAVAEKALELTHEGPQGGRGKKKRGL
jgi:hypothetical protein